MLNKTSSSKKFTLGQILGIKKSTIPSPDNPWLTSYKKILFCSVTLNEKNRKIFPGNSSLKNKIIFICTGNSCRSQIAEGLFREEADNKFEVFSAGSNPSRLHPAAVKVMAEWGIDIQKHESEKIDKYLNKGINIVITVCDNAKNTCPNFPDGKIIIHWSIKDPFHGWNDNEEHLEPYRMARNEIKAKIKDLLQKDEIKNL